MNQLFSMGSSTVSRGHKPELGNHGPVVWHDLVSKAPGADMAFFRQLMGWSFTVEHAENFVWKPGPGDYPLIVSGNEAHGGILAAGRHEPAHWRAYVEVPSVDLCANRARRLGATVLKPPFDIPGVGRTVLLSDPQSALICPFRTTHGYPPPRGQFILDQLVSCDPARAVSFYADLFGWKFSRASGSDPAVGNDHRSEAVEIVNAPTGQYAGRPQWIPYLAVTDCSQKVVHAIRLGARQIDPPTSPATGMTRAVLVSPAGAAFGLVGAVG